MESAEAVKKVVEYCLEHGVITFWFLSCPWSFRIAPPLIISESEIEESCSVIMEAFDLL
jgi:4-aminobutyrate aminotransferase-like enzyme